MTIQEHSRILRRRIWIAVVVTTAAAAVAAYVSSTQRPVYEASAEVALSNAQLPPSIVPSVNGSAKAVDPIRFAATQAALAETPAVAERARESLASRLSMAQLLGSMSVTPATDADILNFTFSSHDPKTAVAVANAYARAFTQYSEDSNVADLEAARAGIQKRIRVLRKQLETQKQKNGSPSPATQQSFGILLSKDQEIRTFEAVVTGNSNVVREASSWSQVAPRKYRNVAIGLVLGLIAGIALIYLIESFDNRIRKADDAARVLGLPLLGRIAKPRRKRADGNLPAVEEGGAHVESIRKFATNLDFANLANQARSIMLTSAVDQEGKSTTAASLALALARAGRRVVLVDLDLRRPYLATLFGIEGHLGVTDLLLGRAAMDEAMARIMLPVDLATAAHSSNGNGTFRGAGILSVVPVGQASPPTDPGDLLMSRQVASLLHELCNRADVVIVDSAPLLPVSDSVGLATLVEGVVLVVRAGVATTPMLAEASRLLSATACAKLGFVLTGVTEESRYGYDSYGYGGATAPGEPQRVPTTN